ncbi:hypothetical protein [Nocardia sp. CA-120079]|uniref:hypothetical protein n=1 Tax=Nocardia sp. CA-120079 TaxID=3239974 RepID=UPI003D97AF2A
MAEAAFTRTSAARRIEVEHARQRRLAAAALDARLGTGRVYRCGEYNPLSARQALADGLRDDEFLSDAKRFALDVLRSIEGGADAVEVWSLILRQGRSLRTNAPRRQP